MRCNPWSAEIVARPYSDLLKDEAVYPDFRLRMDHNTVGVRDKKAAANLAVQRNFGSGHNTPEAMTNSGPTTNDSSERGSVMVPALVLPNSFQKLSTWIPKSFGYLARPIRLLFTAINGAR